MKDEAMPPEFIQAQATIRALQEELEETNRGLIALTMELEKRVERRTAELREAHGELERTNSELMQLTLELEDRVELRTAELQAKSEEATAMSQQLMQAARLATMGELAASIAHELNNPLATISLRVETLLAASKDDPAHRSLQIIGQEVERMANLVANLLQFSRRTQPEISIVDVREEIKIALDLVFYRLRKSNITLKQDFAPQVPLVFADRQQLRQLFINLYSNAVDAMSERGGMLTIRITAEEQAMRNGANGSHEAYAVRRDILDAHPPTHAEPFVVIEIADTGVGILPENLPKVMEPFFTTKPEGQGTGLGLPICRRIVQEHHGTLEIDSAPGSGTTVRIRLPAVNSEHSNERID
jgi:signal transduction histidine kinase